MWQGKRPVVDNFQARELLTFRFYKDDVTPEGILKPSGMPVPDQSMNRLGYGGKLWYALLPDKGLPRNKARKRLCMGIVGIRFEDLPSATTIGREPYRFQLAHDPLPYNYQHCELRLYGEVDRIKKGSPLLKGKTDTAIKKYYREILADRARILLHAEVSKNG